MLTAYSVEPSLPFVLLDRDALEAQDGAPAATVIARLDLLHGIVEETRSEVIALRELNTRLLDLVEPGVLAAQPRQAAADAPPGLVVRLLGAFEVRFGERAIEGWRSRKPRQLLAYLALEPDRPVGRETLIETFWPESAPARGANNLSIAVHHIRARLAELLPDGGGESRGLSVQQGLYRLDPALPWEIDVAAFRDRANAGKAALAAGRVGEARTQLGAAIEAYRGELLASDLTEEWALDPREAIGGQFQWAAGWLAADAAEAGDWQRLLQLGQRLVQRDSGDEAGHRWLIRAHAALGNRGQALRQYQACEQALRDEFGVAPSEETRALLRELAL
jgi:DNA-binding SARP family transcriptional activator